MSSSPKSAPDEPRILVFSTNNISDPGIDLAGSAHMNYSARVNVISLPCSAGIHPRWILRAIQAGFDGVFIAADGGDCAYLPDCTAKTARLTEAAQALLVEAGEDPRRLRMGAICSVCNEPFVNNLTQFAGVLRQIPSSKTTHPAAIPVA